MKEKICKFCGKSFIPKSNRAIYCDGPHERICPVCNKVYIEDNNENLKRPPVACSYACRKVLRTKTSIAKYGISAPGNNPEAREKARNTMQAKYGCDYTLQNEELKKQATETCLAKYGVDNVQKCQEIRQKTNLTNLERYGSTTYLTSEAGKNTIDEINLAKYGTINPQQCEEVKHRVVETNLERYGVSYPMQSTEIKEKTVSNNLTKYGVTHPMKLDTVKNKVMNTWLRKYGVANISKLPEIVDKIQATMLARYNKIGVLSIPEISEKIQETNMERYGVPYYVMLPDVAKSAGRISKTNMRFASILDKYRIRYDFEFTIGKFSYDFVLPQYKILIEIDPSYTHSIVKNHWGHAVSPSYHKDRTNLAKSSGYRCIHIFDWDNPNKVVKSLIFDRLIEKVEIKLIELNQISNLIIESDCYKEIDEESSIAGIYSEGALIQFVEIHVDNSYINILQICTKFGYSISDNYSKILEFLKNTYNKNKIRLYVDLAKKSLLGNNLNFEIIPPRKIWSKGRRAIIDKDAIEQFGETRDISLLAAGWLPVYDCGQAVYEF